MTNYSIDERIARVLLADSEELYIFQSSNGEWLIRNENGCPSLSKQGIVEEGISALPEITHPDDYALCLRLVQQIEIYRKEPGRCSEKSKRKQIPLQLKKTDGSYDNFMICTYLAEDCLISIRPMTAEEIYREELARTITNDKNPAYFANGAERLLKLYPDRQFAFIQFDVARFKMINEQYGEAMGDEILSYFIKTLTTECNKEQIFARLTADVFMIMTQYQGKEDILEFIYRLNHSLTGYRNIPYTLFWGVSYILDRDVPLRKYGDGAAIARQSIKGDALHHIAFYNADMSRKVQERKYMEDRMVEALHGGEFLMYLQPKFRISTGELIGAEALVRWKNPEKGMIYPGDFIPLFEENGFIVPMDEYIWEQACLCLRSWIDNGQEPVPISVNVSRKNLEYGNCIERLDQLIEKYRIDRRYLEIEITESIDASDIREGISKLKEHGYILLMDDFGSGYSSLNTLKDTMFDVIKMDRSFLQNFITSPRGKKIVEHTIQMTNDIGLDMIAEGIETKEQAQMLEAYGCDKAQGFYYARPMPLVEFNQKFMKTNK